MPQPRSAPSAVGLTRMDWLVTKRSVPSNVAPRIIKMVRHSKLKIDKSARIVVPKPLRERLDLKPDSEPEAFEQAGGVLLRAVDQRPSRIRAWRNRARTGTAWFRMCARSGSSPARSPKVVQVFFDTDVLVAASEQSHPHYAQAWPALRWVARERTRGSLALTQSPSRTGPTKQPQSAADRSDNR